MDEIRGDRPIQVKTGSSFSISGPEFNQACSSGDWSKVPIVHHPNKKCKKCFGRGYEWRVAQGPRKGDYVACPCTGLVYNPNIGRK